MMPCLPRRLALLAALPCALLCTAPAAFGQPTPLSDDELAQVQGRDGIGLAVHLELNSGLLDGQAASNRLLAGFKVDGQTTYAVVQDLGGVMDLVAITLDVRHRPDGSGDYLDIGLPGLAAFHQFGFRALGAQTDPAAAVTPATSYGQVLLDGSGYLTGHVYLWAQ